MKTKSLALVFLMLVTLTDCREQAPYIQNETIHASSVQLEDTSHYVIFPVKKVSDERYRHKRDSKLTASDLIIADNKLKEFVASYNAKITDDKSIKHSKENVIPSKNVINIQDYKRQYAGFLNESGERILLASCVCNGAKENWEKDFTMVYGGGSCYFHVVINLTNNTIVESGVNAPK